jgi:hypothetical protein
VEALGEDGLEVENEGSLLAYSYAFVPVDCQTIFIGEISVGWCRLSGSHYIAENQFLVAIH